MNKKAVFSIIAGLGVALFLASLWGGAWLMDAHPRGTAYDFAAYITACFGCFVGLATTVVGIIKLLIECE